VSVDLDKKAETLASRNADAAPMYEKVKAYVLERVVRGELGVGECVPSENELVRTLGVSRMTVNRALNDLTAEGLLMRTPGVGTFVTPKLPQAHPLKIRNIADEIKALGHEHEAKILASDQVITGTEQANDFQLRPAPASSEPSLSITRTEFRFSLKTV
jgi:GntR family transcriptional regulator, histidine utilization repressor